jgi:2-polyprenyl-6-hydroxyphenyl methylase/3-demethylubiquinone-9 3-methyltransferase
MWRFANLLFRKLEKRILPRASRSWRPSASGGGEAARGSSVAFDDQLAWFQQFGETDAEYMRDSWPRFLVTHDFVSAGLRPNAVILDVGSHWLHQAAFFWRDGHKIIGADSSLSVHNPSVRAAASAMGVDLIACDRLDQGQGILDLEENSVDAVLFSEIIEHIAFNPIDMWSALYRALKPGGRIFITTPNSLYYERLHYKLHNMFSGGEYGIEVSQIMQNGPHGHHWKEFSIPELRDYFSRLSPDFEILRAEAITPGLSPDENADAYASFLFRPPIGGFIFPDSIVKRLARIGAKPFGRQLLIEVALPRKSAGIVIEPPWRL